MRLFRVVVLAVVLASGIGAVPAGIARAQCDAYTDEAAGPGGTYGNPAECNAMAGATEAPAGTVIAVEGGVVEGGAVEGGVIGERNATARDNPDAAPADRHTATFEGESEP